MYIKLQVMKIGVINIRYHSLKGDISGAHKLASIFYGGEQIDLYLLISVIESGRQVACPNDCQKLKRQKKKKCIRIKCNFASS